ncbi:MAG: CHASE2 domain-containing protein, partial [Lachnospiraceae bacterium]|nr:CHASE2 domain-containing protein [Lachnospiraceae bacterium]
MGNGITKRKTWIILLEAFLIGVLAFVFCYNDILYPLDSLYKDRVYQRSRGVNQNIKIISIDEKTLSALGPFGTWDRSVYADIIDYLG